jgi:uncharacterized protein with FMN-binding domain
MPKRATFALVLTAAGLALLLSFKTPSAPSTAPISGSANTVAGAPAAASASVSTASTSGSSTATAGSTTTTASSGSAKSGTYTGAATQTRYGTVQVQVTVASGKVTNVVALQYPSGNPHSSSISQYAVPTLISETLQAQSSQINAVSGATYTSQGFVQSLQAALVQAGA